MDKIYGYKQKDIIGLAEFLQKNQNKSLSCVFEQYGVISGKAKGTVRNLYYALAKKSNIDKEFCQKHLGGKAIEISKGKEFDSQEERELIKTILSSKTDKKSVRSIILELSNGDAKKALRYQNKFRNALKNKPNLVAEIIEEIKSQGKIVNINLNKKQNSLVISDNQFERLKFEIDGLVQKIATKIKKENEYLKQRVGVLESENLKLIALLYGGENMGEARKFFKSGIKKQYIN